MKSQNNKTPTLNSAYQSWMRARFRRRLVKAMTWVASHVISLVIFFLSTVSVLVVLWTFGLIYKKEKGELIRSFIPYGDMIPAITDTQSLIIAVGILFFMIILGALITSLIKEYLVKSKSGLQKGREYFEIKEKEAEVRMLAEKEALELAKVCEAGGPSHKNRQRL